MGQAADTIRGDKKIADPKMREALAKYADAIGPDRAEQLLNSVQRDERSVADGFTPRAVATELTLAVQLRPEEAKPLIEGMLGKDKATALLKQLNVANGTTRDTLERDREAKEGFFTAWKPDAATVSAAARPQTDALRDLGDAVQDAMKTSMKPLPTPAAASAPAARGK